MSKNLVEELGDGKIGFAVAVEDGALRVFSISPERPISSELELTSAQMIKAMVDLYLKSAAGQ